MADSPFLQVNQHYLDRVMDLTSVSEVNASEDIFAANGMKLIAKGSRISPGLQERLIIHKLRKPLEVTIEVVGGVDTDAIRRTAQDLLDSIPALQAMIGRHDTELSPLNLLRSTQLNQAVKLLLTLVERAGSAMLRHYMLVALVAYGLANRVGGNKELLQTATTAGLLHDVGELYINPEYLHTRRQLAPAEWKHVVVHPVIADKLLNETGNLPRAVTLAILEHHERHNGQGYPRRILGKDMSRAGQIVAMAEMIAAVFNKADAPLERAELAVKIVPGEHPPELVNAMSSALREGRSLHSHDGQLQPCAPVTGNSISHCISAGHAHIEHLLAAAPTDKEERTLLDLLQKRLAMIERVYTSTGMDLVASDERLAHSLNEHPLHFEMQLIVNEVTWRLRDLARDLALRLLSLPEAVSNRYLPLVGLLADTTVADPTVTPGVPPGAEIPLHMLI